MRDEEDITSMLDPFATPKSEIVSPGQTRRISEKYGLNSPLPLIACTWLYAASTIELPFYSNTFLPELYLIAAAYYSSAIGTAGSLPEIINHVSNYAKNINHRKGRLDLL